MLRAGGLRVTPGGALDAARSLELVDVADGAGFRAALRANLTISVDEYPAFDAAFETYWRDLIADQRDGPEGDSYFHVQEGPPRAPEVVFIPARVNLEGIDGAGDSLLPGGDRSANDADLVTKKDFAAFTASDVLRARRLIQQLVPVLATAPTRRWRPATSGGAIDIRRTVQAARHTGGEVVALEHRRPRIQRLKIVALCDVSGSMDVYSSYLLQFVYALQSQSGGVRTFVFSTRLHDVTGILRRKSFASVLEGLAASIDTWSGGTAIGQSIAEFNARFARRLVGPRTVVLIVSDGWERGDVERLRREMAVLHRRAHSIIWLNPLKGRDGYEPLAAGMAAALPFVDHFLAANTLESLERLKRTLAAL